MPETQKRALIVGAGPGVSASMARKLSAGGWSLALAARNTEKLAGLVEETGAQAFTCDVSDPASVNGLFDELDGGFGAPDFVLYNPSYRVRGPVAELDQDGVRDAILISGYGGFLVAQNAAKRMLAKKEDVMPKGAIFFTGASASVKGYAQSASFAMGKFALRGLAQSMARELQPHGIHIAHFVIDGAIGSDTRYPDWRNRPGDFLDPDAIAATYMATLDQDPSAWTWEIELRPFGEKF